MQEALSVSQLTLAIKKHLESSFGTVSVRGEISNFKEQASGHLYFTLKDAESQISAVLFKGNTRHLSRLPKGGDQVILRGELTVYSPRGNYQIIVQQLEYLGVGELLLKLHELKSKLDTLGWFDPKRKKPLPKYPKTIGVVTSATGAVIQDILHILTRRCPGVQILLNPVRVQGEGAAQEIACAIKHFNQHKLADVLIVGRGGGSLEDLWAFNEERVAAAIYHSTIPIISAVGHETDFCIADFVADVRAPTPSAAAEIVVAEKAHQLQFLLQSRSRIKQTLAAQLNGYRQRLKALSRHPYLCNPYAVLGTHLQRLDDLSSNLMLSMRRFLEKKSLHLNASVRNKQMLGPLCKLIAEKKGALTQLAAHLQGIDPKNLLNKGYCILFHEKKDSVILTTRELELKDTLRIRVSDGTLKATLEEIIPCP
jgi:exodeoxyribonuclease VII large subunit